VFQYYLPTILPCIAFRTSIETQPLSLLPRPKPHFAFTLSLLLLLCSSVNDEQSSRMCALEGLRCTIRRCDYSATCRQ